MKQFLKTVFWLPLFFPLYLLKSQIFGVPLNLLEMVVIFFAAVFFIYEGYKLLVGFFRSRKKLDYILDFWAEHRLLIWIALGLFAATMISVAITPANLLLIDNNTIFESRRVALGIAKGWIILPFLYFVMLYRYTENQDQLKNLLIAYVLSCLPLMFWAFYQAATGHFITLDNRASGPFINANYLAMYLAPATIVVLRMLVLEVVGQLKALSFALKLLLTLCFLMALILTQSYGAMIGVFVAFVFYLMVKYHLAAKNGQKNEMRALRMLMYFLLVIGAVTLLSAFAVFVNTEKWQKMMEIGHRSSSAVRLEVYQISWHFISEAPFNGIGLGQFEALYNLRAPQILGHAPYEWVMIHPHNTFLAFWLNLGLIGLLWYLALIFLMVVRFLKTSVVEVKEFRLLALAMLAVMLIHGMFDTYFFKNDLAMLFFMVLAIAVLPFKKQQFSE